MTINPPEYVDAVDGTRLSFRRLGEGRPLLLVHGFFSSGTANWIGNRHAHLLVERGHQLVIPDLRGHGRSALPLGREGYPPDVLVDDLLVLLDHLGIDPARHDLDAAGYSLGGRTVLRMLVRGVPLRRAVVGGQGLDALTHVAGEARTSFARRVLSGDGPHDPVREWFARQWHRKSEAEQRALRYLLESSVGTPPEQIAAISVPTLVLMGDGDDPADGRALAGALPDGHYRELTGDHVRVVGDPAVAATIADFLVDPPTG